MSHKVPRLNIQQCSSAQLVDTLAQHSCVLLENQPIPYTLRQQVLDTWDDFYQLPRVEKEKVRWPEDAPWYGWQPLSEYGPKGDLMERFELRLDAAHAKPDQSAWAETFSVWPEQPEAFKPAWTELYFSMRAFSSTIMQMIAEGLGRDEIDLAAWTEKQHANLVVNQYYAQPVDPHRGRWRSRPHTDIGALTFVGANDDTGGLEVAINGGRDWVPVKIPADCWLLQAGDLLKLWSGGRIPANPHRVANPPGDQPIQSRQTIVYFHYPAPEVTVTPPDGDPAKAVSTAQYIKSRQDKDDAYAVA